MKKLKLESKGFTEQGWANHDFIISIHVSKVSATGKLQMLGRHRQGGQRADIYDFSLHMDKRNY